MKLKQTLDTLDGLDEALKGLYAQGEDGKYHLDVEGLPEMSAALKQANKEAADRRKALEKFKDVDPEEFARLKALEDEVNTAKARAEGDFAKLREQMAAKHAKDLEATKKQADSYRVALEKNLVDAQATTAIAAAKGIPQLLLPHVKGRVKVVEQDGQFTVQVLDAQGNPMVADAAGTPATIAHLVESMKADPIYGRAFEGTGASGGGAPSAGSQAAGAKTMARSAFETLDPAARMAFAKSGGTVTD